MARGKHTNATKFAHLTRADLEEKARKMNQDIGYVGGCVRRLDLLSCQELARAFSMTSGIGKEASDLLMKKARTFDEILWGVRAAGAKNKQRFLQKAIALCTNLQDAQRLYEIWPKLGQNREALIKKVCDLATTKEELVDFVIRNKLA